MQLCVQKLAKTHMCEIKKNSADPECCNKNGGKRMKRKEGESGGMGQTGG